MQITNNQTTIELNEERLLNLIIDRKIDKLEQVVKRYYEVKTIAQLTNEGKNVLMYLCIVALDKKAVEIAEIYDVSVKEIIEGTKQVFARGSEDKEFYTKVYGIYINYKQSIRGMFDKKNVA